MSLIIHAPGVHVGGGAVLFAELVKFIRNNSDVVIQADSRLNKCLLDGCKIYLIEPSIVGRLKAEYRLWKLAKHSDVVLCFHGLPPLLPLRGNVIVFLQNRYYIDRMPLYLFSLRTKLRLIVERMIFRIAKSNVDRVVVQTPSMRDLFKSLNNKNIMVSVVPFMNIVNFSYKDISTSEKVFDFVYVSDGEGHKNHHNLLKAWKILANDGFFPVLGLTLKLGNKTLIDEVFSYVSQYNLKITNIDDLDQAGVIRLLHSSKALIFPSFGESFGLPLLEAKSVGIPIVASELDYVRDVCEPVETFDPQSPVSIARAVKRFLGIRERSLKIRTADEFFSEIGI